MEIDDLQKKAIKNIEYLLSYQRNRFRQYFDNFRQNYKELEDIY